MTNVRRLTRLVFLSTLLFAGALPLRSQPDDSTAEFWPEVNVFIKLNEKSRVFAMYTATRPENLGAYADGQSGLHVDLYGVSAIRRRTVMSRIDPARSKALMMRLGYLVTRPRNNAETQTEQMALLEGTARAHLPDEWLLSDRNRVDLRWLDGAPRHRYRNRLKLERTWQAGRLQITPYAHAEMFYAFRDREWTRIRYSAGSEAALTKWLVVEGYYLRQNTWGSVPQFVNAVGLVVQLYLR